MIASPDDWGRWTSARFPNGDARDGFVRSVTATEATGWEAESIPEDERGARVRWLPGHFLGLNDLAYASGGRIVLTILQRRA